MSASDLEHVEMLKGVSAGQREVIWKTATRRILAPGEVLIRQGDVGKAMHFLVAGELGVTLGDALAEPIAVLHQGETVGELAVITGDPASAYVVARTESQLLTLDEEAFWSLVHASHSFSVNLIVKLADRLRRNNATVSTNIEKRRLYERAAMFDGLTGIHNRRWLDETLHRLLERHERERKPMCLALLDIDHFKKFNDGHGHDVGDLVLSTVAATLAKNLRPTDLVARFGGEEFVILFPTSTLEEAVQAAERVREVVSQTVAKMPDGRDLPRVTVSVGVAALQHGQPAAALLKAADLAMDEAKQAGRNRVRAAKPA
jgi:diguanylate cyclase (GGDEF)-like protein